VVALPAAPTIIAATALARRASKDIEARVGMLERGNIFVTCNRRQFYATRV
jgi:hypothetical protein